MNLEWKYYDWMRHNTNWYAITDVNTGEYMGKTAERFECFKAGYELAKAEAKDNTNG